MSPYASQCLPARLIITSLGAAEIIEIERINKIAKHRKAIVPKRQSFCRCGDVIGIRHIIRVLVVIEADASLLHDAFIHEDRTAAAERESDRVTWTSVELNCLPLLIDNDPCKKDILGEI